VFTGSPTGTPTCSSRDAREESRLIFKDLAKSDMEQIKIGALADPAGPLERVSN